MVQNLKIKKSREVSALKINRHLRDNEHGIPKEMEGLRCISQKAVFLILPANLKEQIVFLATA